MIEKFLNILILFFFPFLFIGIINRVKAFWGGRKGQPIFQSFFDFVKLLKKGQVISKNSSLIFQITPTIYLVTVILAGLIVPMVNYQNIFSFDGDFLIFAYILAFGRFFMILSAMDTSSSFSGMGASREATYSALIEPVFLVILSSIGFLSDQISFKGILTTLQQNNIISVLLISLCVVAFSIIMITECKRVPVDDPNTHLELTMIHEVMILDNSGPDLGFILYGSYIKLIVLSSIIANLILPANLAFWIALCLFLLILILIAVAIGCIESIFARLRLIRVPQFILLITSVAILVLSIIQFSIFGGLK